MNTKFKQTEIGEIPENWEVVSTEELLNDEKGSIKIGPFGSQLRKDFLTDSGYRVYGQENVFKQDYSIGTRYIPKERFELLKSCELKPDDILITMMGTIGFIGIVPNDIDEGIMDSHLLRLRINNNLFDKHFVVYALKSRIIQEQIYNLSVGCIMAGLSSGVIKKLKFPKPPLGEQKQIVSILSSLNDKIELNQKTIKTLEETGQALFKRWFIDFEFPNEKGEPYKSSGGEMVDSELGEIPKGWIVRQLSDFSSIDRGVSYKGDFLSNEGTPMFNLGSFNIDGSLKLDTLKYYKGKFKASNTVKTGDIIIANTDMTQSRTILGSACITPDLFNDIDVLFTHHIYSLRIKENIPSSYLYRVLKEKDFKNKAIGYATGTTVLFLPKEAILNYSIPLAPQDILSKFDCFYKYLINQQESNIRENKELSKIKDSLLPKLLNGRIRV